MHPRHTGDVLKHLDKQHELLTEAHRNMTHELQKLQVEEEMLMRKFYELMNAHGLNKKKQEGEYVSTSTKDARLCVATGPTVGLDHSGRPPILKVYTRREKQ